MTPLNWTPTFDDIYQKKTTRDITVRVATGSGPSYGADRTIKAGVRYREVGFDPERGVLYPQDRVEIILWLRDWFGRTVDGATNAELAQVVKDLKGDVREDTREHFTRYLVDGDTLKYENHAFDERPDGVVFAVIVRLKAA